MIAVAKSGLMEICEIQWILRIIIDIPKITGLFSAILSVIWHKIKKFRLYSVATCNLIDLKQTRL